MGGGRQREFCKDEALDKAMKVFWKKGYVGASLADLTKGMGINKPSMYAAFGNKEQLFIQSMTHYMESYAKPHVEYLFADKPLEIRLKNYMLSILDGQCREDTPKGCFVSMSVSESEGDAFPEKAVEVVVGARDFAENFLTDFLADEIKAGNLAGPRNTRSLARYIVTILHGTAALARGGKSKSELDAVMDFAVKTICQA